MRQGRAKAAPFRCVWHDTATGDLAALGQVVEVVPTRRGTTQRLVQVMPETDAIWLPGMAVTVLREIHCISTEPDAAALGLDPDETLPGLAAAEGRRRLYPILIDGVPLSLLALDCRLRTVAAQREVARVQLTAPDSTASGLLHEAALRLAGDIALTPAWPLAEDARALARSEPSRPPRRGAPALHGGMTVEHGFAHAAAHLLVVLAWLTPAAAAGVPEAVHQARVAIRRLRSGFAVWRPAVGNERAAALDARLRQLADMLGPVRDRDVFLAETMALAELTLPQEPRLGLVRAAVQRSRHEALKALAAWVEGPDYRRLLLELGQFVAGQAWRDKATAERQALLDQPLVAFAAAQLSRRRRRMLRGHDRLEGVPIATLHGLRLSGKRLRYAVEFFASAFPERRRKAGQRYLKRLARVQEALGLVNDADVAHALLTSLPMPAPKAAAAMNWAIGAVTGVTAARALSARREAERTWVALRDEPPFWERKSGRN